MSKKKRKKRYAPRTPMAIMGGIRSQHAQSGTSRVWWSRRWIEAIERFRIGARLGRGRSYAVSGQVSQLEITPGVITARVQGASKEPYTSTIHFRTVSEEAQPQLIETLRAQPMLVARLLVSELPLEVEGLFREAGCPLFPQRENDLSSRCSCPDYANPCKHLAAVYHLMGEAITQTPLLLLAVRGVSRVELLGDAAMEEPPPTCPAQPSVPDPVDLTAFYGTPQPPFEDFGSAVKTLTPAPLIYRLGPLPFWRGQERFADTLEQLYARAATRGWAVWAREPLDLRREDEKVIITGGNLQLRGRRMRIDTTALC